METKQIISKIESVPYVRAARLWERGSHRRIYIDTAKFNGGSRYNGGVGYNGMYIDLVAGALHLGTEAGAKTRCELEETVDELEAIAESLRE